MHRQWCRCCYRTMRDEAAESWDPFGPLRRSSGVRHMPSGCIQSVGLTRFGGRLRAVVTGTEVNDSRWKGIFLGVRSESVLAPRDTRVGWCAWCGTDLAFEGGSVVAHEDLDAASVSRAQRWTTADCGDMVAAVGSGNVLATPPQVRDRILSLLFLLDEGNQSAFARRFGVSLPTPLHWMRTRVVRLDYLLRICWRSGLHPLDLLLKNRQFDDTLRSLARRATA